MPNPTSTHIYQDINGNDALRVLRFDPPNKKKYFIQQHPENGKWVKGAPKVEVMPLECGRKTGVSHPEESSKTRWLTQQAQEMSYGVNHVKEAEKKI